MTSEDLINKVEKIQMWVNEGIRAPHKPLLILLALRYLMVEKKKLIKYTEIENELGELLIKYGRSSSSINPHQPFWRLRNDGERDIWKIFGEEKVRQTSKGDAFISDLREETIGAGFSNEVITLIENDHQIYKYLVQILLDENFPSSLHNEILDDIGLDIRFSNKKLSRKRDPEFREKILHIYDFKCAICGYDLRFFNKSLALDAAHIKWHKAGGPDIEENGVALCTLHHKLFDFGAIAIDKDLKLIISDKLQGSYHNLNPLLSMHQELISTPKIQSHYPKQEFINWHHQEVFKKKNKKTK